MTEKTPQEQKHISKRTKSPTAVLLLAFANILALASIGILLIASSAAEEEPVPNTPAPVPVVQTTQPPQEEETLPQGFFDHNAVFSDELTAALPQTANPPVMMQEKYKALYAQNADFVGWLTIEGTSIDFPVYQSTESNEKYIRANPYLEYDRRGSIFMDYRCQFGVSKAQFSASTILYGHHLIADESLFAEVENYLDIAYYKEHPTVQFNTLYGDYTWLVYGVFLATVDEKDDNGEVFYYLNTEFTDDTAFTDFVQDIRERSWIQNPAVDVQPGDKLLLLSTCTYRMTEQTDARCVLVSRLCRTNESAIPDVSLAYQNENPRLPQIWYDLYEDGENPWA